MKLITAYIRPEKLTDVKESLAEVDIKKMSVTNSLGCGQQGGYTETYRGVDMEINLLKKIRVDIAVNNSFVDSAIEAIVKASKTGNIGDGKIFVTPIERCIRIRTGQEGEDAIG